MFISFILSRLNQYFRYQQTVRELSQLSDRELDDLGITRYDIPSVAKSASAM